MVVTFEQSLNAESPIVVSWLVGFRVTPMRFVRLANANAAIVVTLSGRVTYWTVVPMIFLNVVGIVVSVLVFWKMMVLKDGQLEGAAVRYGMLDTSRNSVVNLGRFLNTVPGVSVVMEGDNVMEDSLEPVNVSAAIAVSVLLRDKSKEPERFAQPLNALVPREPNDIGAKVSNPEPEQSLNAEALISVILEGKDATTLWQPWNAESPITASRLVEFRVTPRRFVRFANIDGYIVVRLSGRVTYWIVDGMKVENVVGIVVIVLVFLKTMVLKDGQKAGAIVRYEMLDTSRNSVVNLGRLFNTPLTLIVVMEGDIVKEDSLESLNVPGRIVVSVLLRDKSKEPTRFTQALNAWEPRERNDIGAKVSNPEPLHCLKASSPISVIVDGKDATSLWQCWNALFPMVVKN